MLGGTGRVPRPEVAASDHLASDDQPFTSTYPVTPPPPPSSLSAGLSSLHSYQETPLMATKPPMDVTDRPPPSGREEDRNGSLVHDRGEIPASPLEEPADIQAEASRTSETKVNSAGESSHRPGGWESLSDSEPSHVGRLSLFRGMELVVSEGASAFSPQTDLTDASSLSHVGGKPTTYHTIPNAGGTCFSRTSNVASQSSQTVSAFSFLNC